MPDIMTAGHLFGLLHQRQGARQLTLAVEYLAMYRGRHNAAVEVGQRQLIQRDHRQPLSLFRIAIVDRNLCPQGVKFAMQGGIHIAFHLLLGTRQQGIHFAVAVLALHQPGLQQHQTRVLQQALPWQRFQRLFQQRQFAVVKQSPRVVEEDIAQHAGITGGERMVNGLAREALCHPALGGGTVDFRQLSRQLPLATLAQETAKQRVIAEPFAGIVHPRQEQPLAFNLFKLQLPVFAAGHAHNQGVVHGTQQGAFQQEITGRRIDTVQHLIHQVVRKVAGVDPRKTTCRLMRRAVVLPGGEGNQLQRCRPAGDIIAQAAAFGGLNR